MPQLIEVPGIGQVEFPDEMGDDEISSAIQRNSLTPAAPEPSLAQTAPAIPSDPVVTGITTPAPAPVAPVAPKKSFGGDLATRLQQANLYGSTTSALSGAWDKQIRRKDDGQWDLPLITAPSKNPVVNAIGGVTTLLAQKLGGRMDQAGIGVDKGAVQDVFRKFQVENDLSDDDVKSAWNDLGAQTRSFDKAEEARVLSDGSILPNYRNSDWLDTSKAENMILSLRAPESAKANALANLGNIQTAIAANKLESYAAASVASPLESPSDWAKKKGRMEDFGTPAFVRDYEKEVAEKAGWVSGLATDVNQGNIKLASTLAGFGGVLGSDAAGNAGAELSTVSGQMGEGSFDTGLVGSLIEEAPSIVTQIALTRGLGAASAGLGATQETQALVGTLGALATAGGQSAGATFASQIAAGDTPEEARAKAIRSGVSTAVITGIFQKLGAGGVEKIAAGRTAGEITMRDLLKSATRKELLANTRQFTGQIVKSVLGEGAEEGIDELAQAFLTADPDTNLADAWDNAVKAAQAGAFIGGAVDVAKSILEAPEMQHAEELLNNSAELAPAATAAAEDAITQSVRQEVTQTFTEDQIPLVEGSPDMAEDGSPLPPTDGVIPLQDSPALIAEDLRNANATQKTIPAGVPEAGAVPAPGEQALAETSAGSTTLGGASDLTGENRNTEPAPVNGLPPLPEGWENDPAFQPKPFPAQNTNEPAPPQTDQTEIPTSAQELGNQQTPSGLPNSDALAAEEPQNPLTNGAGPTSTPVPLSSVQAPTSTGEIPESVARVAPSDTGNPSATETLNPNENAAERDADREREGVLNDVVTTLESGKPYVFRGKDFKILFTKSSKPGVAYQATYVGNDGKPSADYEFSSLDDVAKNGISELASITAETRPDIPDDTGFNTAYNGRTFLYELRGRPAGPGAVPPGFLKSNEGGKYGIAEFDRILTAKEISDFELKPIGFKEAEIPTPPNENAAISESAPVASVGTQGSPDTVVGRSVPEAGVSQTTAPESGSPAAPPELMPHSVDAIQKAFGVDRDVAEATDALAQAMGLDTSKIVYRRGGVPGGGALSQDEAVSPEGTTSELQQGNKGTVEFLEDGTALIRGFKSADASTGVHELSHVARRQLFDKSVPESERQGITDDDINVTEDWAGVKDGVWTVEAEEKFARANEKYLREGVAPTQTLAPVFAKMAQWLSKIYAQVTGSPIDIEITAAMREILDKLYSRGDVNQAVHDSPAEPTVADAPPVEIVRPGRGSQAMSDEERAAVGLPPRLPQPVVADAEAWAAATATEDAWRAAGNPGTAGTALMDNKLANADFVLTSDEQALTIHEIVTRRNNLSRAQRELTNLPADAADLVRSTAQKAVVSALELYNQVLDFNDSVGSEEGRSFRMRRWLIALDYSFEGLSRRASAAKNRYATTAQTLTPSEIKEAEKYAEIIAQQQARIDELTTQSTEQGRIIEELTNDVERAQKRDARSKSAIRNALAPRAEEAKKRLEERGISFLAQAASLEPQVLKDLAAVTAEWLLDKPLTLAEFSSKLATTFGTWVVDHAQAIFDSATQVYNETAESVKTALTPAQVLETIDGAEDLDRADVWALARAHVIAGKRGANVLDSVFTDLQTKFPDLTRAELATTFTDYGKVIQPSKDETTKELSRVRNMERIALKIADLKSGKFPKVTGYQRDPGAVDLEVRKLEKEFQKLFKQEVEAGRVTNPNPERAVKSALASAKTRMENELQELQDAIDRNQRIERTQSTLTLDADATALRAQLEAKRNEYAKAFPAEPISDAERVKQTLKALDRQIAEETEMIRQGVFQKNSRTPVPETAEIAERRRKLAEKRQTRRDLYEAQNPGESALKQAQSEADKAIERLKNILAGNEKSVREKKNVAPDEELWASWYVREVLQDEVKELRRMQAASPAGQAAQVAAAIKSSQAALDRVNARLASGDLSVPERVPTAADRAAVVQVIRDRVKAANKELDARRRDAKIGNYSDDARLNRQLASIAQRRADLERRIRDEDISKKPKPTTLSSRALEKAKFDLEKTKGDYQKVLDRLTVKNAPLGRKAIYYGIGIANLMKVVTLGLDVGVFLRQLGTTYQAIVDDAALFAKATRSKDARTEIKKNGTKLSRLLKGGAMAFINEDVENTIYEKVRNRPGAEYDQVGTNIKYSPPFDSFNSTADDIPRADLLDKVPWWMWPTLAGIKWALFGLNPAAGITLVAVGALTKPLLIRLDRAQRTMTNIARAEFADAYRRGASADGARMLKPAEYSLGNNAVMVATGRGTIKVLDPAIPVANQFLLATRFYLSRIMALTGQPIWAFTGDNATAGVRARAEVTKMYGKSIAGRAVLYGILIAMLGRHDDDDDDSLGLMMNPYSSDFGRYRATDKLKIDFMSGINGFASISARYLGRRRLNAKGEYEALGGGYTDNVNAEAMRFVASKRNLLFSFIVSTHAGEYFGGKKVTPGSAFEQLSTAIIMNDVKRVFEELGPVKGAEVCLLMFGGAGVSTRQNADEAALLKESKRLISKETKARERELNE